MTGTERVSVVITVYNAAQYLGEAIESALAQTRGQVEVVVVDDGSDDGSAEVAARYPVVLERSSTRLGIGAARNVAVARSTGDFLTFLDADDRFPVGKLAAQLAVFDLDPTVDVVYGEVDEFVSPDLSVEEAARIRPAHPRTRAHMSGVMLIRRTAFDRVGPWTEGLKVGTGVDWYMRSAEADLHTVVLDEVLLERRLHLSNNGLREASSRTQYVSILKEALDRRRGSG